MVLDAQEFVKDLRDWLLLHVVKEALNDIWLWVEDVWDQELLLSVDEDSH